VWSPRKKIDNNSVAVGKSDGDRDDDDRESLKTLVRQSERVALNMTKSAESWLRNELEENDVTGLLFYRGRWCESFFFCS